MENQYGPSHELRPKISPNKMQVKALRGIEKVRERGETKALLISATGFRVIIMTRAVFIVIARFSEVFSKKLWAV